MTNPFFKNTGPYVINDLLKLIKLDNQSFPTEKVLDIKDLNSAENGEITFFHSKKYTDLAKITRASYCLTTENLKSYLPKNCKMIITDKVLLHTALITKIFYPDSVTDHYDNTAVEIEQTIYKNKPINFNTNEKFSLTQDLEPIFPFVPFIMMWNTLKFRENMKKKGHAFFTGKVGYYPVSYLSSIIIKYKEDFQLAQNIIRSLKQKKSNIEYFKGII